jgi:hypothetical protein
MQSGTQIRVNNSTRKALKAAKGDGKSYDRFLIELMQFHELQSTTISGASSPQKGDRTN